MRTRTFAGRLHESPRTDIHYDGQVLKIACPPEQCSIHKLSGLVLKCPIPSVNMPEDVEPGLRRHQGLSQFSTTLPSIRALFAVQDAVWWTMRNQNVGVLWDARV
jgi:hypothetical protein